MQGQSVDILAICDDISKGYSEYNIENYSAIYIKHLTHSESLLIRDNYDKFIIQAEINGVLSENEQIKLAFKYGWWSEDKENQINAIKSTLKRLHITRSKLIYDSDKKRIDEQIKSESERLKKLTDEKSSFIVMTAEEWATKQTSDFFLKRFIFKDRDLNSLVLDKDLDDESEVIIDWLTYYYFKYLGDFSGKIIKRAAISHYFQNILYVANTPLDVFGKCAINLTKNQHELLIWGKYYQSIIKNSDTEIPDSVYDDPEKLDEWLESVKNKKRVDSKIKKGRNGDKGSTFLFGDRQDIKNITGGDISGYKIISESSVKGDMGIYDLAAKS